MATFSRFFANDLGQNRMFLPDQIRLLVGPLLIGSLLGVTAPAQSTAGYDSVRDYLPPDWQEKASIDLRKPVQKALNENGAVFFPGGTNEKPVVYPSRG